MRRGVASLIMGLSLLVATASWAGFILSRTVLDPGRSERLADNLLDNPDVRDVIVDRLADAVEAQIPAEVPVTRELVEESADAALDDPRVEALIRDGFVQAHQNALNGIDEPVMLDATALGAAGRDAVVARQPELDPFLPQTPAIEVELPNTGLSWLGSIKSFVDRYTLFGAILSVCGVSAAFVLARNRAAALRRIAFWAFGASAFWLIVAYALPWILEQVAPSSVSIASAVIDVFFSAMIRPAMVMTGFGVGLLLLSFAWPAIERRRPAAKLDRAAANQWEGADSARAVPPQPAARTVAPATQSAGFSNPVPTALPYSEHPGYQSAAAPSPPADRWAEAAPSDTTKQFPQIHSNVGAPRDEYYEPYEQYDEQPTFVQDQPQRQDPALDDHGWAFENEIPTPAFSIDPDVATEADDFGAEWVEGVGYVEDEPPQRR